MLALGLAAVRVTFAVLRTVLLRPLPFRNADRQLWARGFQSDHKIVEKSILLSGTRMTVIGVMPSGFEFPRLADVSTIMSGVPEQSEFWVPLTIYHVSVWNLRI
jgi:hypothetical protein